MSTVAVAKKDFKAARRSAMLWAGAIFLGLIAALAAFVAGTVGGQSAQDTARELFQILTMILAVLLPIVALIGSYLAIAGERESGGIKFLLGLPNTRREVFLGKLASRVGIVAGGVGFVYLAAISVALTRLGTIPVGMMTGTFLLSVLYGTTFVSIALSMSAAAASKSRAMAGAVGSYFVLVILYIFPLVSVPDMVEFVHTRLLDREANPDLYNAVEYASPYQAYEKAINLVVPEDMQRAFFADSAQNVEEGAAARPGSPMTNVAPADLELPVYLTDEFSLVVLSFWLVVPLLAGYWLFERSDLE